MLLLRMELGLRIVQYHHSANCSLTNQLVQLLLVSPVKQFESPLTNIVHCLLNLPLESSQSTLFPNGTPTKVTQFIIDTLNRSIPQDTDSISDSSIDENLSPVISLLYNLYEVAPDPVKESMKEQLLPSDSYDLLFYKIV